MKDKIKVMLGNTVMVRAYSHCMMVSEFEGRLDSIDDPSCQVWAKNGNLFFHTSQVTQFEKTDGLPAYIEVDWDRPITVASTKQIKPETVILPKDHQCREAIKWSRGAVRLPVLQVRAFSLSQQKRKNNDMKHHYHCVLCGTQLDESGLGVLACPNCNAHFIPCVNEAENTASVEWVSPNKLRQHNQTRII